MSISTGVDFKLEFRHDEARSWKCLSQYFIVDLAREDISTARLFTILHFEKFAKYLWSELGLFSWARTDFQKQGEVCR